MCRLQRPDIRAQSYLVSRQQVACIEEESIYGHLSKTEKPSQRQLALSFRVFTVPDVLIRSAAPLVERFALVIFLLVSADPSFRFVDMSEVVGVLRRKEN